MDGNDRILLIDDDPGVLESYRNILAPPRLADITSQGLALFGDAHSAGSFRDLKSYSIVACERGEAGVTAVRKALERESPFAAAFIDISMPGINGTETARRIWSVDRRIKIVIVTAYSKYSPDDIIGVTHREDLFFLRKPFHSAEIRQFARALTRQWNLEVEKDSLSVRLEDANRRLEQFVRNLQCKVDEQALLLVQSEKMASIGLLVAGVAHEINNPISFVDSNLNTLKKYVARIESLLDHYGNVETCLEEGDTEGAVALVETIQEFKWKERIPHVLQDMAGLVDESLDGTRRVKGIVRDLKIYSRFDRDEMSYIDLNENLDSAITMIWNELKYKARIERDYQNLPQVRCNPQKISQVFLNLLLNAAQAIEGEGVVRVATHYVCDGLKGEEGRIEVTVSDNGCGIPSVSLSKIFDPFFTTKPVGQGTGLGLSIAYDIVRAHGGEIRVASKEGEGTTFSVMIPVENPCR